MMSPIQISKWWFCHFQGKDLTIFASGSEVNLALEVKMLKEFSIQIVAFQY